MFKGGQEVAHA